MKERLKEDDSVDTFKEWFKIVKNHLFRLEVEEMLTNDQRFEIAWNKDKTMRDANEQEIVSKSHDAYLDISDWIHHELLDRFDTDYKLWTLLKSLKRKFNQTEESTGEKMKEIVTAKQAPTQSVHDFIEKFVDKNNKLKSEKATEENLVTYLVHGLRSEFRTTRAKWTTYKKNDNLALATIKWLRNTAEEEEMERVPQVHVKAPVENAVFLADASRGYAHGRQSYHDAKFTRNGNNRCKWCSFTNHDTAKCFRLENSLKKISSLVLSDPEISKLVEKLAPAISFNKDNNKKTFLLNIVPMSLVEVY